MNSDVALTSIASCASLLDQHSKIHMLSVGLTLGVTMLLAFAVGGGNLSFEYFLPMLAVILLGLFETIVAVRIGFDRRLLNTLSQRGSFSNNNLELLDDALVQLKLIPANKVGRILNERLIGCVGLLKLQAMLCCFQFVTIIVAGGISL